MKLYEIYFPSKGAYTVDGIISFQDQVIALLTGVSLVEAKEEIGKNKPSELKSWSRIYNIPVAQMNGIIKEGDVVISNGKIIQKADKAGIEHLILMR